MAKSLFSCAGDRTATAARNAKPQSVSVHATPAIIASAYSSVEARPFVSLPTAAASSDDAPSAAGSGTRGFLLRGHVSRCAAEPLRRRLPGPERVQREVEVQQQRLCVGGQKDVRGLQVEMDQAALVGVGQTVGQAGANTADRLDVGQCGQSLAITALGGEAERGFRAGRIERRQ